MIFIPHSHLMFGHEYDPVLELFGSGEFGAVWDPWDISTLWQDTSGTTPVTTSAQLCARMDDKTGNGLHFFQASSPLRPTYIESGGLKYLDIADPDYMTTNVFTTTLLETGSVFVAASNNDANALGWLLGEYEESSVLDRIYLTADTRSNRVGAVYAPAGTSDLLLFDSELDTNAHVLGYVDEGSVSRLYVDDSAQTDTGTPTSSFAAGDRRLALGDRSQFDGQFEGKFRAGVAIDRPLTSPEIVDVTAWLSTRAGI